MAKTKLKLTAEQRRMIHNTVGAALMSEDGKTYEYREGYSDEMIAKRTGVTTYSVARIRSDFYGPLKKRGYEGIKYGALVDQVKKLSDRLAAVEARMSAMGAGSKPMPTINQSPPLATMNGGGTLR